MDMALADKAHKLARSGNSGPEIAKAIGVQYATEAHAHAAIGRARANRELARLTEPELLLIRCLAAEHRRLEADGACSSPKAPNVAWRAKKASGWPSATAARRLGTHRKGDHPSGGGTGLRMVTASRNGHIWLTPAGWALVHALECAS
jgi:hypothetical protein